MHHSSTVSKAAWLLSKAYPGNLYWQPATYVAEVLRILAMVQLVLDKAQVHNGGPACSSRVAPAETTAGACAQGAPWGDSADLKNLAALRFSKRPMSGDRKASMAVMGTFSMRGPFSTKLPSTALNSRYLVTSVLIRTWPG